MCARYFARHWLVAFMSTEVKRQEKRGNGKLLPMLTSSMENTNRDLCFRCYVISPTGCEYCLSWKLETRRGVWLTHLSNLPRGDTNLGFPTHVSATHASALFHVPLFHNYSLGLEG